MLSLGLSVLGFRDQQGFQGLKVRGLAQVIDG